jgi:hypothetical protein
MMRGEFSELCQKYTKSSKLRTERPDIYSYLHKKRNVSFEKPFFNAIF